MNHPRRALLFSPGTEHRKIEKAAGLPVDGVILDLEDAAAASRTICSSVCCCWRSISA